MAGRGTADRKAVVCAVLICVWTPPWAALSVADFDPWLAPSLFSPGARFGQVLLYGSDWLAAPSLLLVMGMLMAGDGRGRRWLIAWTAGLVMGSAFEVAAIPVGKLLVIELYDPAHRNWRVLGFGGGFVLLAAVMAALLAGSPRRGLAIARVGARAVVGRATRTRGGRALAACGVLAVVAVLGAVVLGRAPSPAMRAGVDGSVVTALAFSPDGGDLALADDAGDVSVRAIASGRPVLVIPNTAVSWGVNSIAFSPRGGLLALGEGSNMGEGGGTQAWSTVTGRRLFSVRDPVAGASVHAAAFSPDGVVIASGDDAGSISLLNAATGHQLTRLATGQDGIDSVAFSPDERELADASYDGTVSVWDIASKTVIASTEVPPVADTTSVSSSQPVSVSFRPDGRTLAIGDARSGLYLWTAGTSRAARQITWSCFPAFTCGSSVAFSPDGKSVAVTTQRPLGRDALVWSVASGALLAKVSDTAGYYVSSAALSPDGHTLAIGDDDGGPDTDVTFPSSAYVYKIP